MPISPTVNSKLRVLIAKTYKAEKLFLSMKSSFSAGFENQKLIELANNVRAEVWGNIHSDLRKSLNSIVNSESSTSVVTEINKLKSSFRSVIEERNRQLEKTKQMLFEMGARGEFIHTLKLSLELVKLKATIQANQTIIDELNNIINGSALSEEDAPADFNESVDEEFNNVHVLSFNRRAV